MNTPVEENREKRTKARALFWQGWRVAHIARELAVPSGTIQSWKQRDRWDAAPTVTRIETAIDARLTQLIYKDQKEGKDFKEIDLLTRQLERIARVNRYNDTGKDADLNPSIKRRNAGPKKAPRQNAIDEGIAEKIHSAFMDSMFDYQKVWYDAGQKYRIRDILKSRQIGATFHFAREALVDAIMNGNNQIFLSASKAQAHVFKQYIVQFAREAAGVELRGDPIILENGAHLYFLGTNSRTAQSYHGNLYLDEFFWIPRFLELRKVASGMAMHKKWKQTYFSTPSSLTHEAFPFWSGKLFNRGKPKDQQVNIDTSHTALAGGRLCEDGHWRQIVTVEDAVAGGCDLFDIDQLRREYNADEFANLLMCQFIDDSNSVFPFAELQRCMVDSWVEWNDFKPFATRPFGNRAVWVGYDPASTGDSAGLAVLAPPMVLDGKFRVLERMQFRGLDFAEQAAAIEKITQRYNVVYIGVDATGVGEGVYQLVREFFPAVTHYQYSPEIKSRLVLKAKDVISKGRLEFDAGHTDLAQAFMAIRKTMTASGRRSTYEAGRGDDVGHADIAWAVMHALDNEPFTGTTHKQKSIMEIS